MATAFNEMHGPDGELRPAYQELSRWLKDMPPDVLAHRREEAELLFRRIGITFAVYGDNEAQRAPHPVRHHPAHPDGAGMDDCSKRAWSSASRRSTLS